MSAMDVMIHSSSFLLPCDETSTGTRYALVVLNQSLPRFTPLLWEHGTDESLYSSEYIWLCFLGVILKLVSNFLCRAAKLRLCADGGANRIYDELPLFFPNEDALAIRNRSNFRKLYLSLSYSFFGFEDYYSNLVMVYWNN